MRFDNYRFDLEKKVLRLRYWNVEIPFAGKPKWLTMPGAEQGRLTIAYDPVKCRWYAHVSVRVKLERERNSGLKAGIDLGREITAAAAVEDGTALLYRGGPLKSDYFYFERKTAEIDKTLSDPKSEEIDRAVLRAERRRLYGKRRRRRDQTFANLAAHLAKTLKALGVGVVFVGYPRGIAHDHAGKGNTNFWSYRELAQRLATTLENHGIAAFAIPEDGTSRVCARHGCEVAREPRRLVKCPFGHTTHSDMNAALNILWRGSSALGLAVKVPERVKVLSFAPTPSKVVERGSNPALKAG